MRSSAGSAYHSLLCSPPGGAEPVLSAWPGGCVKFRFLVCLAILGASITRMQAQETKALELIQTIDLPPNVIGKFDHFGIDLEDRRLFATPMDSRAVLVIDLATGGLHRIEGVATPHAVLYRADVHRIYVTDGSGGDVKIFDGTSYGLVQTIKLQLDADATGYDPGTQLLYVESDGRTVGLKYSMLNVVDTSTATKLATMRIEGDMLAAIKIEAFRPRLYINNYEKGLVAVIDTFSRKQIAAWPVAPEKDNDAMALDEEHQRLFVACRTGRIQVFDTDSGKVVQTLAIPQGVDDLAYDPVTRRLYAPGNGSIAVYEETDRDHFTTLGSVASAQGGKTAILVPELKRYFVAVPRNGNTAARILVFRTTARTPTRVTEVFEPVHAAAAQNLVLSTMSAHPLLRRLELHARPPGRPDYLVVAQGNSTKIGTKSNESDLNTINSRKTLVRRVDRDVCFDLKVVFSDSTGRSIGLLVFEIPFSAASTETEAIRMAEGIRGEMEQKVPNRESLFLPARH